MWSRMGMEDVTKQSLYVNSFIMKLEWNHAVILIWQMSESIVYMWIILFQKLEWNRGLKRYYIQVNFHVPLWIGIFKLPIDGSWML